MVVLKKNGVVNSGKLLIGQGRALINVILIAHDSFIILIVHIDLLPKATSLLQYPLRPSS